MNNLCELCQEKAEFVCFCEKSYFCVSHIGPHMLENSSLTHRPVSVNEDLMHLVSLSLGKLIESEKEILEKAAQQHKTKKMVSFRLLTEIQKVNSFHDSSCLMLQEKIKSLKDLLDAILNNTLSSLKASCDEAKSQLLYYNEKLETEGLSHNSFIDSLLKCSDSKQIEETDLIIKSFSVKHQNFNELVQAGINFSLKFNDCQDASPEHSPDITMIKSLNTEEISADEENDLYARLRFSVNNLENHHKLSTRYRTVTYNSPQLKPRRNTYTKSNTTLKLKQTLSKDPSSLIWVDKISECLLVYSIPTQKTSSVFLPNQSQEFEGSVWCFINDGSIVLTGGNSLQVRRQTLIIDYITGNICNGALMHVGRYNHAMVCVGNYLYAIGGSNGNALRECEKYDVVLDNWQKVGNLNVAREYLAACVHRGRIYVAGGEGADSIEAYNTVSNKFSLLRVRLPTFSKSLMASVDDQMIIFHGNKIISFDSAKMSYIELCDLNEENWYTPFSPIVYQKTLFFIKKATVYSLDTNKGELKILSTLT